MSLKNKFNKSILAVALSLFVVSGVVFIKPEPAKAIFVEDFVNLAVNIKDTVWKLAKSAVEHAGTVLFKNTTKYFLNNLAYNAATAIVEGGTGKTPLFPKLQPGDMLKQAAGDALGEFIDGAIGEAGLQDFDICNPASMKTTLNILMPSFREVDPNSFKKDSPYKAKCQWQDIKKNWTEFKDAATKDPAKYLLGVKAQFKDGANDLDIKVQVSSNLLNKQQESKAAAQLNIIANQYINPIVSPISKFIKTPASVVGGSFQNSIDKSTQAETTFTNDLWADALGIFTNTLAAKLQKKIMAGLDDNSLPTSKVTLQNINNFINPNKSSKKGVDQFADFKVISTTRSGDAGMDVFEKFSSERLPLQGDNSLTKGPGSTSEVLPDFVMVAARQELTVKQAVDQGIIPPNIQFGFSKQKPLSQKVSDDYVDSDIQNDDGSWSSGLSYRGLLIGRTQRVFPQSWELAALYWRYYDNRASGPLTIKSAMDCFADSNSGISPYGTRYSEDSRYPEKCRRDMNGDGDIDDLNPMEDYNPYFHLVDPNWVLKLPVSKCLAKGPGSELVYESLQCSEDNVDAGVDAGVNPNKISRGEGTAICDVDQAKKLGMNKDGQEIKYDIPTKTITRDDNYCADWQSCIKEDNNGKCISYGYCVEEKPVTKLNATGCAFPADSNNGYYSSCDSMQIAGQQYNLVKNTLKKCLDSDAGCKQYSTKMKSNSDGGLDWDLSDNRTTVFLNKNATDCDKSNDGCTKVAAYNNGINLAYNGNFSVVKFNATTPSGWLVEKDNTSTVCDFKQKFNNEEGVSVNSDGVGLCSIVNETPFLVTTGYEYLLNFKIKTEADAKVGVVINGVNEIGENLDTDVINATSSSEWVTLSYKLSLGANYTDSFVFPLNTKGIVVKFVHSDNSGKIGINEVELKVANGPLVDASNAGQVSNSFQTDYTGLNFESYKLPPKYLSCELFYQKLGNFDKAGCVTNNGVWNEKMNMCAAGGRAECDNFAPLCSAQDVGCQLFKTTNGSLSVPAKVSGDDICPNECIGYDSYSRQPSFFEANEYPSLYTTALSCQEAGGNWDSSKSSCVAQPRYVNLIPNSAAQCSAAAVGCQSFTNLSSSATGGEKREYFSFLRPCVTETASTTSKVFYTWEGSDTSGYQLKKWTRLVSNLGSGPCTNVDTDTGACLDTGNPSYWSNGSTAGNRALCTKDDLQDKTDCRDFFDINDKHYFVYQSKTVISRPPKSADACVSYRNDLTGKTYNADPADAVRCSEQEVGCRTFKGGTSNNIRTVIESKFDGQFDGWKNTEQEVNGLSIYNDSLRQGGSSMLVNVSNDKVVYKTSNEFIDTNKEYTLVILAKKVTLVAAPKITVQEEGTIQQSRLFERFATKALAQTVQDPITFAYDGNLQNEWREYRIGPIVASDVVNNEIKLKINNLGNDEAFAIDEIRLLEGRDIYYLVDKTWETPVSCDNPINNLLGCDANGQNCNQRTAEGAQLGCQEYLDKKENSVSIKAFTQLCSPAAVDCQAFIDTANSKSPAPFSDVKTCDANNGVIKGDYCLISGVQVCKLDGDPSCSYSTASVAADKLIYFVPSEEKSCNQQYAGCMAMGKPGYDLTEVPAKVSKFDTVYLLNNPDKYSDILCSASGLMCEVMVAGDGSQGVYVSPIGADEKTSRLCVYDNGRNRWVEKADPEKNCELDNPIDAGNRSKYMTTANNVNYRGWVGMCESDYVGCKEYRNPEQAMTNGADWCDATVSASEYGVCDSTKTEIGETSSTTPDGKYCQKKISGLNHLVCKLNGTNTKCNYTATDWTCFGQEKMEKGRDENGVCQINGNNVCVIKSNSNGVQNTLSCSYSPLCSSSYAIGSSVKQCGGGQVDRGAGCAPFYDVSLNTLASSAKATKDKGVLVACDASAKPGEEKYCNTNVVLENRLTRQCSEWLYCTSGAKVGDKNVCFDVGRCAEADAKGSCVKPSTKMNTNVKNQTYKFENIFDRENVRYSTGYSRTGLEWSSNKAVEGYASPEAMSQSGSYASLINGDFETLSDGSEIKGWKIVDGGGCVINDPIKMFDGKDAWDGYYSLKIDKKNDGGFCSLTSNSGEAQGPDGSFYLPFNAKRRYVLSFAAKSSSGDQVAMAGLNFYDNNYNPCAVVATQADFNAQIPASARDRYISIGTYENQTMYYNKICVEKNGSTTLTQTPSWIWGYLTKINKIKKAWTNYTVPFDPNSFDVAKEAPSNASYAKIVVFGPHPGWGDYKGDKGAIWLDNVKLDSSLQVSENKYNSSMCRLYPSADAKQCNYNKFNRDYKGWNGYCLEEDPYMPGQCLQWFPIDSVGSDGLNGDDEQLQAYDNRSSLYMCVASTGVYDRAATTIINTKLCHRTWLTGSGSYDSSFADGARFADIHNAKVWLEHTTCDDYNTDDWSYMIGAKDLSPGYYVDGLKKLPALWWGGAQTGGSTYKGTEQSGDFGFDNNFSSWYGQYNNPGCPWNWGGNCNKAGVGVLFNEDGSFRSIMYFIQDGSGDTGGLIFNQIAYYLKDECRLMAKVVNDNGENKVVQSAYNNGWTVDNPMGYSKTTPGTPFGSLIIKDGLSLVEPNLWSSANVPFNFESSNVGMPLYALRKVPTGSTGASYCQLNTNSTNQWGQEEICQGSEIKGISTYQCSYCAGIGKYKYDGSNMRSTRCDNTESADCLAPKELHPASIANFKPDDNIYKTGIDRLKKLFAKVYGWYELTYSQGKIIYKKNDFSANFYKDFSKESGGSGIISNIKVADKGLGNVNVDAPGASLTVTFKVDIPDAQLPIRKLYIDWGDGTQANEFNGEFNERSSDGNPFTFSHWYGCVPTADGNRCRACTKPGVLPGIDGSCKYDGPKILAQDNWEWCAVSLGSDLKIKYGDALCQVPNDLVPYDSGNGKIIVKPREN